MDAVILKDIHRLHNLLLLKLFHNGRQVKIMRNIVNLAHDLDAQVVCEGVETDKDAELMMEIGAYSVTIHIALLRHLHLVIPNGNHPIPCPGIYTAGGTGLPLLQADSGGGV